MRVKNNNLKFLLPLSLFIFLFISINQVSATTYYVSSSGNDSNNGTSTSTPWQTLNKVSNTTFQPGDNILFKKGDTFYGTITVKSSGTADNPITYSSYGSGEKPIITGFTEVTEWTNKGGNIWESTNAVSTLSTLNMVTVNDVNTPMGRYPNTGYFYFQSHSDNFHITSNNLTGTPNWTGAELALNPNHWETKRVPIKAQSGGTLTFTQPESFTIRQDDLKFIIQNDIRTLDTQNEWYYNPTTKKISIYSTSEPTNVKLSTVDVLVNVTGKDYVTFNDIEFKGSNDKSIKVLNSDYLTIDNCDFNYSGLTVIYGSYEDGGGYYHSDYLTVSNSNFNHSNDGVIGATINFEYANINNNTITNTGMIYGANRPNTVDVGGGGGARAISAKGRGSIIEYNRIIDTGYVAIAFLGSNIMVRNNYIENFNQINHDGAGIYTFNNEGVIYSGTIVQHNIILNEPKIEAGHSLPDDAGIYLDGISNGIEITHNTIETPSGGGIYLNGSHDVNVNNNNIYNSLCSVRLNQTRLADILITNNNFIAKSSLQHVYWLDNADIISFLISSDYNIMDRPSNSDNIFELIIRTPTFSHPIYSLSEWKSYSGQDVNSSGSPVSITNENDLRFEYNATKSNKTISLSEPMIDVAGAKYSSSVTLLPYTSIILLPDPNPTPTPDTEKPLISSFTIPGTSTTLEVPISTFTATDNIGVTGYLLTENSTTPSAVSGSWSTTKPTSYTFTSAGTKTLYAWARDEAGNVSTSVSRSVVVTLPPIVYTLAINKSGTGTGSVSGAGNYNQGTLVTATATPATGSTFSGWSGDCDSSGHVTMNTSKTCVATFTLNTYTIVSSVGSNGTISPQGSTIKNHATSQTYTITPSTGYHIANVVVDSVSVGTPSSYSFTNIIENHTISVTFAVNVTTPVISNIVATPASTSSVNITWTTSELSNSQIEYGLTTSYGKSSTLIQTPTLSHSVTLSNLNRNTTYHYKVKSTNSSSVTSESTDQLIKTLTRLPKTPKVRSISARNGSVILTWSPPLDDNDNTYELYTGVIIMKSDTAYIQSVDTETSLADVSSSILTYKDTDVVNGTKYYYSVFAYDDLGSYSDPEFINFTPSSSSSSTSSSGGGGGGGGSAGSSNTSSSKTCLSNEILIDNICKLSSSLSLIEKAKAKDIKKDGFINILDFNIIMVNWGKNYKTETREYALSKGDMFADGIINILDLNQVMVYWGVGYNL